MTPPTDLAEFVSDYLQIEGAQDDTAEDIAAAYADQNYDGPEGDEAMINLFIHQTAQQIAYYL